MLHLLVHEEHHARMWHHLEDVDEESSVDSPRALVLERLRGAVPRVAVVARGVLEIVWGKFASFSLAPEDLLF